MTMLDYALRYLRAGLAPIPLWNDKRKNPRITGYSEYCLILPVENEIRRWWRAWPGANIGLITGYWRNFVALDFDATSEYDLWARGGEPVPADWTWTVRTGRGYHVWFELAGEPGKSRMYRHPSGVEVLLRAKGGYVIAPPSVHHSGKHYRTVINQPPLKIGSIKEVLPGWVEKTPPQPQKQATTTIHIPRAGVRIEDLIPPIGRPGLRGSYQARCPFHDDARPSAWVNPQQQRFGCNACWPGQWWDVVNVYAMMQGITNGEAFKQLRGDV